MTQGTLEIAGVTYEIIEKHDITAEEYPALREKLKQLGWATTEWIAKRPRGQKRYLLRQDAATGEFAVILSL